MNLACDKVHSANRPNLSRINPGISFCSRCEFDVFIQVSERFGGARRAHPVGRESDPATIFGLDGRGLREGSVLKIATFSFSFIQQIRNIGPRPHAQPLGNPLQAESGLRPKLLRDKNFLPSTLGAFV